MKWFFAFIEAEPYNCITENDWPVCICLNHPVILTRSLDRANDFIEKLDLKCPPGRCEYCSRAASHHRKVQEIDFSPLSDGRVNFPVLYISYTETDYIWSFNPKDIPINSVISYQEPILPNVSMDLKTWKRC